jgi:hypothetical protein
MLKSNVAIILGAGFSKVANLPLTWELFQPGINVRCQSKKAQENNERVLWAFENALKQDCSLTAEVWLSQLYVERGNPLQLIINGTIWADAIRFILARLVNLPKGSNTHYYHGIGTYQCHPVHRQFWERVENEFNIKGIVTMNYDILVEQALHIEESVHRTAPRCHYGGFMYNQTVRKMTDIRTKKYEELKLGNEFPLFKLHGSINWAWEPHSTTLKIHHDVRPAFRISDDCVPAIVPPIPEKHMPLDFGQIWNEAKKVLSQTPIWIICGYSMPDYDQALRDWFGEILKIQPTTKLIILDPNSNDVAARWKKLYKDCNILALQGLPDALTQAWY